MHCRRRRSPRSRTPSASGRHRTGRAREPRWPGPGSAGGAGGRTGTAPPASDAQLALGAAVAGPVGVGPAQAEAVGLLVVREQVGLEPEALEVADAPALPVVGVGLPGVEHVVVVHELSPLRRPPAHPSDAPRPPGPTGHPGSQGVTGEHGTLRTY